MTPPPFQRRTRYWLGLAVCWVFFALLKLYDRYDGITSIIGAPIVATVLTVLVFPAVVLLGQGLRFRALGRRWYGNPKVAVLLLTVCLVLLLYGESMGLTHTVYDEVDEETFSRLPAMVGIPAFLGFLFAVTFWPGRQVAEK